MSDTQPPEPPPEQQPDPPAAHEESWDIYVCPSSGSAYTCGCDQPMDWHIDDGPPPHECVGERRIEVVERSRLTSTQQALADLQADRDELRERLDAAEAERERLIEIADRPELRTCPVCDHVNTVARLWGWGTCEECASVKGEEKAPVLPARDPAQSHIADLEVKQ